MPKFRWRRRADEVQLRPVYEITISTKAGKSPLTKVVPNIAKGTSLALKCTANDEFDADTLAWTGLDANQVVKIGASIMISIESFEAEHARVYECSAKRKADGVIYSPQVRLRGANTELNYPRCRPDDDYCGPNGICYNDNERRLCDCRKDYSGTQCENVLVSTFEVKAITLLGTTSGGCFVIFGFLAVLFFVLYLRKKRTVQRMVSYFGELPPPDPVYGDYPSKASVYQECTHREGHLVDKNTNYGFSNARGGVYKGRRDMADSELLGKQKPNELA